jgi:hypothetical protein
MQQSTEASQISTRPITEWPTLNQVSDIKRKSQQLLQAVKDHPYDDKIYLLTVDGKERPPGDNIQDQVLVAGSAIVCELWNKLFTDDENSDDNVVNSEENHENPVDQSSLRIPYLNFDHPTTEVIMLSSHVVSKRRPFLGFELKVAPYPTIDSLLLDTNLPCCRVVTGINGEFWVSAQCLASLLTGIYRLPSCLQTYDNVMENITCGTANIPTNYSTCYDQFIENLDLWSSIGFQVEWMRCGEHRLELNTFNGISKLTHN